MPHWWLLAVALPCIFSALFTPAFASLAMTLGLVDKPDGARKLHTRTVPFLGGISIFLAFVVPVSVVLLVSDHFTSGDIDARHFIGFFLGGVILLVGGILDDKYTLPPQLSLLFPLFASLAAVACGIGVEKITNPLGGVIQLSGSFTIMLSFLWLLGMTYTTKLLDGLDGLATGVTTVGAIMIALLALSSRFYQPDVALLALMLAAALFGFWLWNIYPAKIFLGEGGSTFLGYALGVLAIISGSKLATTLLVVGLPVLDVLVVIGRRWYQGKPIMKGDRSHLHHALLDAGVSPRLTLLVYMSVAALFGVTTLMFTSWQKVIALALLVSVSFVGIQWVYRYVQTIYDHQ